MKENNAVEVPWIAKTNTEVASDVLKGKRLPKTDRCPEDIYEMMLKYLLFFFVFSFANEVEGVGLKIQEIGQRS